MDVWNGNVVDCGDVGDDKDNEEDKILLLTFSDLIIITPMLSESAV